MKEEKFKILQFIREFIVRVENELENFPKKDIEIKKRIKDISYELLELVYRANLLEEPKEKKNLLIKAIAKVKIIDFLINLSYDRELLPQKRYIKLSEKLDDIVKYISGLLKTYNKQQQGIVVWLASSYVNANSNNSNFGLRNVNSDGNVNNYNLWNSNGNTNNPSLGVRAVVSL